MEIILGVATLLGMFVPGTWLTLKSQTGIRMRPTVVGVW